MHCDHNRKPLGQRTKHCNDLGLSGLQLSLALLILSKYARQVMNIAKNDNGRILVDVNNAGYSAGKISLSKMQRLYFKREPSKTNARIHSFI